MSLTVNGFTFLQEFFSARKQAELRSVLPVFEGGRCVMDRNGMETMGGWTLRNTDKEGSSV